jgi:hypothetical protein
LYHLIVAEDLYGCTLNSRIVALLGGYQVDLYVSLITGKECSRTKEQEEHKWIDLFEGQESNEHRPVFLEIGGKIGKFKSHKVPRKTIVIY